jgi:hypothetical protein
LVVHSHIEDEQRLGIWIRIQADNSIPVVRTGIGATQSFLSVSSADGFYYF